MKSIKGKILLVMILTVTVSLLTIGLAGIFLNYNSTSQTLDQTMQVTAKVSAERVSFELQSIANLAKETGTKSELSNPATSTADKVAMIEEQAKTYGMDHGNIAGLDGNSLMDGNNYLDREYFQQSLKGNTWISDPLISKATGKVSVVVSAPLWKDGVSGSTVVGVVFFVPSENFLNDVVSSIQVSDNGSAYMINKDGTTIAHRNMDNVKNMENTMKDAQSDSSLSVLAGIEKRMTQGESGFSQYTYGGVTKFLAYAPVAGSNGWSIGINAPVNDFMSATVLCIIITVALLAVALTAAILLAFFLANRIGKPMRACTDRLILLSKGDLSSAVPKVSTKDETALLADATDTIVNTMNGIIGDLDYGLQEMANGNFTVDSKAKELYVGDFQSLASSMYKIMGKLTVVLKNISESADQVSNGSDQVSAGAQALSQGTTEQAASVEELAATIGEISTQVKSNAENAREASGIVNTVAGKIVDSNEKMKQMVEAMNEISKSSEQIGKIIKTIEDIAFQTNILALNAAVEAARAGSSGKGFAVVADEVRNLAGKSQEASKNTSGLIASSLKAVENGSRIAVETAQSLREVVKDAEKVATSVNRISGASGEQAASISQVTQGVDQISDVVQTNSATAEESAAASEELSSQAELLKKLVATFRLKETR